MLDPLIATGGTAIAALNMITEWGIPGIYALSSGWINPRHFSREQDQAALHPGFGGRAQERVDSLPGNGSGYRVICTMPSLTLGRYGSQLLILT